MDGYIGYQTLFLATPPSTGLLEEIKEKFIPFLTDQIEIYFILTI